MIFRDWTEITGRETAVNLIRKGEENAWKICAGCLAVCRKTSLSGIWNIEDRENLLSLQLEISILL